MEAPVMVERKNDLENELMDILESVKNNEAIVLSEHAFQYLMRNHGVFIDNRIYSQINEEDGTLISNNVITYLIQTSADNDLILEANIRYTNRVLDTKLVEKLCSVNDGTTNCTQTRKVEVLENKLDPEFKAVREAVYILRPIRDLSDNESKIEVIKHYEENYEGYTLPAKLEL